MSKERKSSVHQTVTPKDNAKFIDYRAFYWDIMRLIDLVETAARFSSFLDYRCLMSIKGKTEDNAVPGITPEIITRIQKEFIEPMRFRLRKWRVITEKINDAKEFENDTFYDQADDIITSLAMTTADLSAITEDPSITADLSAMSADMSDDLRDEFDCSDVLTDPFYSTEIIRIKLSQINLFAKDLILLRARSLNESQKNWTSQRKLKKNEAEAVVARVLKDEPYYDWTQREMESYLKNNLCSLYSYVSIGKLASWKKWKKKHLRTKTTFVALTDLSMKSIDSTGKTHFSRKKNASNYSDDD